jgi:hypothetical protein
MYVPVNFPSTTLSTEFLKRILYNIVYFLLKSNFRKGKSSGLKDMKETVAKKQWNIDMERCSMNILLTIRIIHTGQILWARCFAWYFS